MSRHPSRGCSILRHLVLLAATCLPAGFAASPARAADDEPAPGEAHLPETVVIGRPASGPRGLPDAAAAADRLDAVPGNTDLIEADGFTRTQFVDPLLIRYAAVYPGANGLEHGAATLGGAVNLVVLLGNHGNGHRDFRIAGKARLGAATFTWIRPGSARHDLKPRAIDLGHESDDGHWAVRLLPEAPGTHAIAYLGDRVVHYAPKRSIHSTKTFFRVEAGADAPRALEPLGHPLELVPLADPAGTAADGGPIRVRLLFRGEPMAGARVSFIPRSVTLEGDFDPDYERRTDAGGVATFPPPGSRLPPGRGPPPHRRGGRAPGKR